MSCSIYIMLMVSKAYPQRRSPVSYGHGTLWTGPALPLAYLELLCRGRPSALNFLPQDHPKFSRESISYGACASPTLSVFCWLYCSFKSCFSCSSVSMLNECSACIFSILAISSLLAARSLWPILPATSRSPSYVAMVL